MRCTQMKANGQQCRGHAITGSERCFFHDPDKKADLVQATRRGGERGRMAVLPPGTPDLSLESGADVLTLVAQTINQVRRGEVDPKVANAVGYLSQIFLKTHEVVNLEERIRELQEQFKESEDERRRER